MVVLVANTLASETGHTDPAMTAGVAAADGNGVALALTIAPGVDGAIDGAMTGVLAVPIDGAAGLGDVAVAGVTGVASAAETRCAVPRPATTRTPVAPAIIVALFIVFLLISNGLPYKAIFCL